MKISRASFGLGGILSRRVFLPLKQNETGTWYLVDDAIIASISIATPLFVNQGTWQGRPGARRLADEGGQPGPPVSSGNVGAWSLFCNIPPKVGGQGRIVLRPTSQEL